MSTSENIRLIARTSMHKACSLKDTNQMKISLGGCMTFSEFSITSSKKNTLIKTGREYKVCSLYTTFYAEQGVDPIVFVVKWAVENSIVCSACNMA